MNMTPEEGFKLGYQALCRKYGIIIDSCRCCPPMVEVLKEETRDRELAHNFHFLFDDPLPPDPPPAPRPAVKYRCDYCGAERATDKGPPVCECVRKTYEAAGGVGLLPTMNRVDPREELLAAGKTEPDDGRDHARPDPDLQAG